MLKYKMKIKIDGKQGGEKEKCTIKEKEKEKQ